MYTVEVLHFFSALYRVYVLYKSGVIIDRCEVILIYRCEVKVYITVYVLLMYTPVCGRYCIWLLACNFISTF